MLIVAGSSTNRAPALGSSSSAHRHEHPRRVTVTEAQHVAAGGRDPFEHAPGPRRDLPDRLAARHRSAPDRPVGELAAPRRGSSGVVIPSSSP